MVTPHQVPSIEEIADGIRKENPDPRAYLPAHYFYWSASHMAKAYEAAVLEAATVIFNDLTLEQTAAAKLREQKEKSIESALRIIRDSTAGTDYLDLRAEDRLLVKTLSDDISHKALNEWDADEKEIFRWWHQLPDYGMRQDPSKKLRFRASRVFMTIGYLSLLLAWFYLQMRFDGLNNDLYRLTVAEPDARKYLAENRLGEAQMVIVNVLDKKSAAYEQLIQKINMKEQYDKEHESLFKQYADDNPHRVKYYDLSSALTDARQEIYAQKTSSKVAFWLTFSLVATCILAASIMNSRQ